MHLFTTLFGLGGIFKIPKMKIRVCYPIMSLFVLIKKIGFFNYLMYKKIFRDPIKIIYMNYYGERNWR